MELRVVVEFTSGEKVTSTFGDGFVFHCNVNAMNKYAQNADIEKPIDGTSSPLSVEFEKFRDKGNVKRVAVYSRQGNNEFKLYEDKAVENDFRIELTYDIRTRGGRSESGYVENLRFARDNVKTTETV